ncbi:DUF6090 family protein [Robiginitalea sp. SC105]|uniref:DUF6090 family protein n=1 Tax=Robiginitalea sp. SC105 TaxID=2762332 RepID=UPI00163AD73E|nr:DUF6090 family protein [Robiginitalea sp. SC105]MBC2837814.1 hypothetical protein [Robiginitalea sp. SC105]
MLHFFRQLRHSLLTQNRTSKYLLYALGEIALVVIGILIALQIDNWNESRKEQAIYYAYLIRLESDFESIIQTVKEKKVLESDLIDLAQYQLDFLTGKVENPDVLKLAISMEFNASVNRYELSSQVFKELTSTGRLALIESDSLRNMLSGYDQWLALRQDGKSEWDPWVHEYRSMIRNLLEPEDREYIDFQFNIEHAADPNSPAWDGFRLKTQEQPLIAKLLAMDFLKGILQDIKTSRRITLFYQEQEIAAGNLILSLIRSERCRLKPDTCSQNSN